MRVLKFGGTSLANPERIGRVTSIVEQALGHGRVVVVVSALAGVTDALDTALRQALAGAASPLDTDLEERHFACAREISETAANGYRRHLRPTLDKLRKLLEGTALLGECPPATRDRVLATGERLAAPLVTLALRHRGLKARTFDGSGLIVTGPSGTHRVDFEATRHQAETVLAGRPPSEIAVVTGFVAGDAERHTTTLGRGASDYSATLLGAALIADRVEIWTDVDGVLSAEPRLVPQALSVPHLTYGEAADLAGLGARILHPKTLEPLAQPGVPLLIRNTLRPDFAGTRVDGSHRTNAPVRVVTALPKVVRLLLRRTPGQKKLGGFLEGLDKAPLLAAWETPGQTLSLIVPEVDEPAVAAGLAQEADALSVCREELSLVAAMDGSGELLTTTAPVLLQALAEHHIRIKGLFQPDATKRILAMLVERSAARPAVRLLHRKLVSDRYPETFDRARGDAPRTPTLTIAAAQG